VYKDNWTFPLSGDKPVFIIAHMKLKFWGAAQTVTGSQHLLELDNGKRILLDCGLYQGQDELSENFNYEFSADPSSIDTLVLSHAHIDHCGNIPRFVKAGFNGRVYCTHATYDLAAILLEDSAMIQEKDNERENKYRRRKGLKEVEPLYTLKDVRPALNLFFGIPYDKWHRIGRDVQILFKDAGHILGSASVTLRITENGKSTLVGFTGDVGRYDRPILRDPDPMDPVEYLISESTYGGKIHELQTEATEHFLSLILETCVKRRGKLIVPAFSVGRTQDLVHTLDKLENQGKLPKIQVFVDSPLAINATQIFELHPECFDDDLVEYMRTDPNPFGFNGLHYIRKAEDSIRLNERREPCIIISASGMITSGRIMQHLRHHIGDSRNTVLIVGYCAKGTIGEKLASGSKSVRIYGDEYDVKAKIEKLSAFSAHADQEEMVKFLSGQEKAKKIFLVHGDLERSGKLRTRLQEEGFGEVLIPGRGDSFEI